MTGPLTLELDIATHSLDALHAAAYRLLSTAACQIGQTDTKFLCTLFPADQTADPELLKMRFLTLVTDESLRERLAAQTEPVRNLILSLAFGSLAVAPADPR